MDKLAKPLLIALLQVRIYLKDRADLAFSFLLPIAIFALTYGAFGGETSFNGTAHIVNEEEGGLYSALLLDRLGEVDNLDVDLLSASKAESKLDRVDLLMVVFIPSDFSERLEAGEPAKLVFKQRGNGGDEGQIVASIVGGVANRMAQELQVRNEVAEAVADTGISQSDMENTVQQLLENERESPSVTVEEEIVGVSPDIVNDLMPGILVMFVLFAITLTARALVEERKRGTLERLLTTQLSIGQLFVGKFLVNFSRGLIQALVLILLAYAVFQMFTPLAFVESLVIVIAFVAAVSSLGLIIGSIARSEDQSIWIAVFFTMATVILGGTFFEIPESGILSVLSKLSINSYAIDAFETIISDGDSLSDIGIQLGVMTGVAVIGLFIGRSLFRVMPGGR
ncbi:MAG: ABC transporter permease [Dehalococcoidia bacterium]|nr:MAG: ABC transporter permease [Dehalococcoidia bacterium]